MSRTISFKYDYPYCGYSDTAKYGNQWAESRTTLNGCYTYPMEFNNPVPGVRHMKIEVEVENTGSGTIYGRSWDFMVYRQSYGWVDILTFIMPNDGLYTIDTDIPNYNITKFAVVPTSNPGSSRTWDSWFGVEQDYYRKRNNRGFIDGRFQYGIFPNRYGITQRVNEVYVNMGGVLTKAKDIMINIDTLVSLPRFIRGTLRSTSEQMKVFEFTLLKP